MRLLHTLAKTRASFDGPNLISHADLVPLAALAGHAGLHDLAAAHVPPARGPRRERGPEDRLPECLYGRGRDSIDDTETDHAPRKVRTPQPVTGQRIRRARTFCPTRRPIAGDARDRHMAWSERRGTYTPIW